MAENLEKKSSQNLSSQNDDFLDWNDYDEEYEEDDKNDFQNEPSNTETKTTNQKDSEEMEEDTYSDTYSRSKTTRDYTYSSNTYRGKNYNPYYNRGGFNNKRYNKQTRPFNKGYDTNYHRGTNYYKNKHSNDIYNNYKDHTKYNKDYNYEYKKEYKTVEKEYDYDNNKNDYKKSDRKNFADRTYGKKDSNYHSRYKSDYNMSKKAISYSTREFIDDDKKYNNKNNYYNSKQKFREFDQEEEIKEKTEEVISKPQFYNSKIGNNKNVQEAPIPQRKFIKIADFIQIENMINNINKIVKDTYTNLKDKPNKNIEEQYGSLNINAQTYIPKKKILNDNNITNNNINYGPAGTAILNNNMPQQNYFIPYIK